MLAFFQFPTSTSAPSGPSQGARSGRLSGLSPPAEPHVSRRVLLQAGARFGGKASGPPFHKLTETCSPRLKRWPRDVTCGARQPPAGITRDHMEWGGVAPFSADRGCGCDVVLGHPQLLASNGPGTPTSSVTAGAIGADSWGPLVLTSSDRAKRGFQWPTRGTENRQMPLDHSGTNAKEPAEPIETYSLQVQSDPVKPVLLPR